jgi:hypothetical protein
VLFGTISSRRVVAVTTGFLSQPEAQSDSPLRCFNLPQTHNYKTVSLTVLAQAFARRLRVRI